MARYADRHPGMLGARMLPRMSDKLGRDGRHRDWEVLDTPAMASAYHLQGARFIRSSPQKKRAHACQGAQRRSSHKVPPHCCERSRERPMEIFRERRSGCSREGSPSSRQRRQRKMSRLSGPKARKCGAGPEREFDVRVLECHLWHRAELEQGDAKVETEETLLVTEGASVDVRHTVDGDLLESITHLPQKIEVAETESQLALRVGNRILGETVSGAWAPSDFLPRFSFGRSSTAIRKHATFSPCLWPSLQDTLQIHCPASWSR